MHLLLDLFSNIPPASMAPLNQSDYFAIVLVPEAALLLIHQDLQAKSEDTDDDVPRSRALQVLRDSRRYGEAMFPVEEDLEDNVAEDVARRRATKIRRQNDDSNSNSHIIDLSDSEDNPKTPKVRDSKKSSSEKRATPSQRLNFHQASQDRYGPTQVSITLTIRREPEQKKKKKINLKSQPEAFSSSDNGAKSKKAVSNAWLWTP